MAQDFSEVHFGHLQALLGLLCHSTILFFGGMQLGVCSTRVLWVCCECVLGVVCCVSSVVCRVEVKSLCC